MRFFTAAIMAVYAAAESMPSHEFEFMKWVATWNKSYGTKEEYKFRLEQWLLADDMIKQINDPASGHTHTAGHNKISDQSREEYKKLLTLPPVPEFALHDHEERLYAPEGFTPNGSKDWRGQGCVTAVKNQEQCGSCYAFSATETAESSYCLAHNTLYTLSPQQIVDCSTSYGNNGCNGGWYFYAWAYMEGSGLELESSYPYTGRDGTCKYNASLGKVKTTSGGTHIGENESAIMSAINTRPVSVAIAANSYVFQTYTSGVITSATCGTYMDHAVEADGYNSSANPPYYIVRNSWGATWGDKGYVNIEMTSSGKGICGINQMVYTVETKAA